MRGKWPTQPTRKAWKLFLLGGETGIYESFIAEILRHVNGTMCINPSTGKFHLQADPRRPPAGPRPRSTVIRGTIWSSQRKGWDETVNEINVSRQPQSEESEVVTVHDPANITIQGAIADSCDMYGIRNIASPLRCVAAWRIQGSPLLMQVDVTGPQRVRPAAG